VNNRSKQTDELTKHQTANRRMIEMKAKQNRHERRRVRIKDAELQTDEHGQQYITFSKEQAREIFGPLYDRIMQGLNVASGGQDGVEIALPCGRRPNGSYFVDLSEIIKKGEH
jgi:hypothetical protein